MTLAVAVSASDGRTRDRADESSSAIFEFETTAHLAITFSVCFVPRQEYLISAVPDLIHAA